MATLPINPPQLLHRKSIRDLGALLIKEADLHEGLYELSIEIQIAVGTMGPTEAEVLPGAIFGVKSIGLLPATKVGPFALDAAVINPAVAPAKAASRSRSQSR